MVCGYKEVMTYGKETSKYIRKRKDGRWEGRYTAGYDSKTGKRIIKNVLGKTQAEVKEKLAQAQQETAGLDVARSEDYTVASWLRFTLPTDYRDLHYSTHRKDQVKEADLP